MKLEDYLKELEKYKTYAGKVSIDQWLRWTGAAHLGHYMENLKKIDLIVPAFAVKAAEHKLNVLQEFEKTWENSAKLEKDFQDAYIGIFNLGIVEKEKIIRCSQPSYADLSWFIGDLGARAIINLRNETEYWDGYTLKNEEEACAEYWAEHVHMPMEDWDDPPPTKEQINAVLEKINFYIKPIIIHCGEGKNRTSLISAAYKLTKMGKIWDEVIEEEKEFGFDPEMNPNQMALMKSFVPGNV